MPTIIRKLPIVSPDAAALTPILVPDVEMSIYNNPLVKNWWRAADGFDSTGWRCRKTDAKLIPARTTLPTQVTLTGTVPSATVTAGGTGYTTAPTVAFSAPPAGGVLATGVATVSGGVVTAIKMTNQGKGYATAPTVTITGVGTGATATAGYSATGPYNSNAALQFGTGLSNGELYDGGLGLFPVNADFSVFVVARPGPSNDSGYIWGTGGTPGTIGSGAAGMQLGSSVTYDGLTVTLNGYNAINSGGGQTPKASYDAPIIHIASFDDKGGSAGECNQMAYPENYSATISAVNVAAHNTIAEFHVGGAGAFGSTPSLASLIEGGDIAELMIVTQPLHLSANAALLSQLRTYLGARYGITVP